MRVAEGRGGKGNEVTMSTCEEEVEVEGRYGYSELFDRNGGLSSSRVKMGVVAQCPVVGAAIGENCEGVIVVKVVRV